MENGNQPSEDMPLTSDGGNHLNAQLSRSTSVVSSIKGKISRFFTMKTLKKRLPCLVWMPKYDFGCLIGDIVAGLTVGLLIMPQALAYGLVAGLPPNYGLYSAFVGCFVYFFLGSTKELTIGPTAIMSLMTLHYSSHGGPDYAILLCFTSGVIELVAGVANLGFLINFISQPVISGFTSAAAITIASSQLKGLFGLKIQTKGLLDIWFNVFKHIGETLWPDLVLGLSCIFILTFMKEMRTIKWKCLTKGSFVFQRIMKKSIFFLSVGRNALIVFISSLIAFGLDGEEQPFTLTGEVTAGVPPAQLPPFSTTVNNVTMNFFEIMSDVGVGVFMIPFIAILDNIAIVGAFAKGKQFDATQEIIALGVTNIIGAFFSSIPTTGSLSRTAVNATSGVRTPAGGLVTGVIVLLALAFLTPYFKFIPKSTLAAVIICAVMHLVDYEIVKLLWRSRKSDLIPLFATFVACLFIGLEWGILLGIGVNLSMMLFSIATPAIHVTTACLPLSKQIYVLVTPTVGIFYPSTLHVSSSVLKAGLREGKGELPVIVNCSFLVTMDYTSAKGLKGIIEDFEKRKQPLIFVSLQPDVKKTMEALKDVVSSDSLDEIVHILKDDVKHSVENGEGSVSLSPFDRSYNHDVNVIEIPQNTNHDHKV